MNDIKQLLENNGYRLTETRQSILKVLYEEKENHLTIEDIYQNVKKYSPQIVLATVYRNVNLFQQLKVITKLILDDEVNKYELKNESRAYFHLLCTKCGEITEVNMMYFKDLQAEVCEVYGFTINVQSVTFKGLCNNCSAK